MFVDKITIAFSAFLPIVVSVFVLFRHRHRLGLIEVYFIAIGMFYGGYTVVDVWITKTDDVNVVSVIIVMLLVTIEMLVTASMFAALPPDIRYYVSFSKFIDEVNRVDKRAPIILAIIVIAWQLFIYVKWGIVGYYSENALREEFFDIPSWVNPVRYLFVMAAFALFMWLIAELSRKNGARLLSSRTILLIILTGILAVNGRRIVLIMLVIGGLVWVVGRGNTQSLFRVSSIFRLAGILLIVGAFSNVYQTVRGTYLQHSAIANKITSEEQFDFFEAIQDLGKTSENLEKRVALWRFHYFLMDRQLQDLSDLMLGEATLEGAKSIIPRALYPDKILQQEDFLICTHYIGMCPAFTSDGVDYPQTMLAVLQADFGFLSCAILPLMVIIIVRIIAAFGRSAYINSWRGGAYIIILGVSTIFLMSIEQNVGDWFNLLRNIAIIGVLAIISEGLTKPRSGYMKSNRSRRQ